MGCLLSLGNEVTLNNRITSLNGKVEPHTRYEGSARRVVYAILYEFYLPLLILLDTCDTMHSYRVTSFLLRCWMIELFKCISTLGFPTSNLLNVFPMLLQPPIPTGLEP